MRLANEKTIELNVTHEIMGTLGAGAVGITQRAEGRIAADVLIPYGAPFIIQYKASRNGTDGIEARFNINNNPNRTQHHALDVVVGYLGAGTQN